MTRAARARSSIGVSTTAALLLALAACGGGGDSQASTQSGTRSGATTTTAPAPTGTTDPAAQAYVGLSKADAIDKAEADGHPWRITREDDQHFPATLDYNPDRVSFEIDKGKVTQAIFG
jgi:hypothetical protein